MIIQINPVHPSPYQIDRLVTYLEDDGVVEIPTDTTYALACLPQEERRSKAVQLRKLDPKKALASYFPA